MPTHATTVYPKYVATTCVVGGYKIMMITSSLAVQNVLLPYFMGLEGGRCGLLVCLCVRRYEQLITVNCSLTLNK